MNQRPIEGNARLELPSADTSAEGSVRSPIVIREDLSNRLVHLTRGETLEDARETLTKILTDRFLRGGSTDVHDGSKCVCFSEAPIAKLGMILAQPEGSEFRYRPFGIMVSKQWLFDQGGRPVIYQPASDADLLPVELRYRHKGYEPPHLDFTFEREWRIQIDKLIFKPDDVTVVCPTRAFVEEMKTEKALRIQRWASAGPIPRDRARLPWHFIALEDLGVSIPGHDAGNKTP